MIRVMLVAVLALSACKKKEAATEGSGTSIGSAMPSGSATSSGSTTSSGSAASTGSAADVGSSTGSGSSTPSGSAAPDGSAAASGSATDDRNGSAASGEPTPPATGSGGPTPSNWSRQTGPGFVVSAPNAAKIEKVPARDGVRAFDRYTFHMADVDSYVVEITEVPTGKDVGMELMNMRMRITGQTQAVRAEDLIEGGEVLGRDIWYVIDHEDDVLRARSKLVAKGQKIYEVRGVSFEDKERELLAEQFVDSFAFAP